MRLDRYIVLLDACVLAPMPVADTLLTLAEDPAFYTPRWSAEILAEVARTLLVKFKYSPAQVQRRLQTMQAAFPGAMVDGYSGLVAAMKNDPKDHHVLAAAIRCGAHAIVSDNKKHFPRAALDPYGIDCITANEFIEHQYHLDEDEFIGRLTEQAARIGWTLRRLITKHVPCLARLIVTQE